ncbi:EAL domain-containing protein [Thalassotalea piscium]|uniref:cyclic-guanylate-specific phosphodiesterase n=1 Tax=Thalassotalea piscium TaxID=1230533 RepID=A0A7X0NIR1_9GAMM|nr:EAL domain-containing protein [Thalassotalea piscium]MBB6544212.1 diguanylate cyclase (GGDEF)-like protein/PAS domain S-box-containing protein [Thalassotalea piscium]
MESSKINHISHEFIINDPLHQLFDAVAAISVQGYDEQRRVIYWNLGSELLYGYSKEEAFGNKLEDLIIPHAMREGVIQAHSKWINKGIEIPAAEITLNNKDGSDVNVFSSHVMFINQYNKKQMYCIDIDLKAVKTAQAEALLRGKMLATVLEATPDLFFLMEENGTIIDYHASDKSYLRLPPNKFLGKSMLAMLPKAIAAEFKLNLDKAIEQQGVASFIYELTMPHGLVNFEARISHLPEHKHVVTIVRDVTEQHKTAEVIRKHAYFDTLTLLPNRFLSLDRLDKMLQEAKRHNEKAAVFFLDLDDFKKVNDTLGHEVGDTLLKEASKRLNQVIREEDTVGRLGGDEFIVLTKSLTNKNSALSIVEKLLNAFREPFSINGRELIITLSVGIAVYPENGTNASDLLRNADTAMYQAKALGRNSHSFFTKEMNVGILRRFEIEEQMRGALERKEFEVYYQPQFNVESGAVIGAEALLRWHNQSLGTITPDEFIPIAEHTGLIVDIGRFVIEQALDFLNTWQMQSKQHYTMAVNLSPRQFRDNQLLSFIKSALQQSNIPAEYLELEITEGVLMTGQSFIDDTLAQINAAGIKLSMDDFGTGYSSLSYLRQYDFDVLKIDRSFVNGIALNKADRDLVKAAVAMAHSLDLMVVAEGVETKEQLTILEEFNCDYAQGYYFSKPLPAKAFIKFVNTYTYKFGKQ